MNKLNYFRNLFYFYILLINNGIKRGMKRWCEKTPRNVQSLDHILKEFDKNIKIILMIRNAKDVLTSKHPNKKGYYINLERWIFDTEKTLEYEDHPQVLIVPYEAIITDFERTIKKVMDFLGSEYSNELLNFDKYSNVQTHDAFHGGRVRPIYSKAIMRWKDLEHYDKIQEFNMSLIATSLDNKIHSITNKFVKS